MTEQNKWDIPSWGAAQGQIREAIHFLCEGKSGAERAFIIDEIVGLVRAIGRGREPELESNPRDQDEYERESWARGAASHVVGGAMRTAERLPQSDRDALLREIAKLSLWHMPNSRDEVRQLTKFIDLENLKQPHPMDKPPGRD
jgi:hypothetical protein